MLYFFIPCQNPESLTYIPLPPIVRHIDKTRHTLQTSSSLFASPRCQSRYSAFLFLPLDTFHLTFRFLTLPPLSFTCPPCFPCINTTSAVLAPIGGAETRTRLPTPTHTSPPHQGCPSTPASEATLRNSLRPASLFAAFHSFTLAEGD